MMSFARNQAKKNRYINKCYINDFFCLQIQDSKGHILSQKEDIPHGKLLKFSFVTETYDTFEICFISRVPNRMYTTFLTL